MLKRWNEGCHNAAQIFREIEQQGYLGQSTIVGVFVRQLRKASGLPPKVRHQEAQHLDTDPTKRPPTLRALTWYVVKQPKKRSKEDEQILAQISNDQPKVTATIELARRFSDIIRERKAEDLDAWLEVVSRILCK